MGFRYERPKVPMDDKDRRLEQRKNRRYHLQQQNRHFGNKTYFVENSKIMFYLFVQVCLSLLRFIGWYILFYKWWYQKTVDNIFDLNSSRIKCDKNKAKIDRNSKMGRTMYAESLDFYISVNPSVQQKQIKN